MSLIAEYTVTRSMASRTAAFVGRGIDGVDDGSDLPSNRAAREAVRMRIDMRTLFHKDRFWRVFASESELGEADACRDVLAPCLSQEAGRSLESVDRAQVVDDDRWDDEERFGFESMATVCPRGQPGTFPLSSSRMRMSKGVRLRKRAFTRVAGSP